MTIITLGMSFPEWLTAKYVEWRGDRVGRGTSMTAFAKYLGVRQSVFNEWMQGRALPGKVSLRKLGPKYPDVYEVLDIPSPEGASPFDALPPDMARALQLATEEVNRTLEQRSLTGSSPEAERITIEIFEKFGFKYVRTEEVEEE